MHIEIVVLLHGFFGKSASSSRRRPRLKFPASVIILPVPTQEARPVPLDTMRNQVAIGADSMMFTIGMYFMPVTTVLSALAAGFTSDKTLIGAISLAWYVGWMAPQLWAARMMRGKPRMRPYALIPAALSRPVIFLLALWLWMGDGSDLWKVFPGSLLITLLALIVWALLPRNIDRAADVARAQPLFVGGVGAFSLIAGVIALIVSLVLIVTLCTNPLIATAAIGLSWTVTARIIGAEVARALDRAGWTPTGQVAVGSLIMALLGAIPLIGNLFGFAFVSLGLGALVLTRLGTREWRPTADDRRPLEEGP